MRFPIGADGLSPDRKASGRSSVDAGRGGLGSGSSGPTIKQAAAGSSGLGGAAGVGRLADPSQTFSRSDCLTPAKSRSRHQDQLAQDQLLRSKTLQCCGCAGRGVQGRHVVDLAPSAPDAASGGVRGVAWRPRRPYHQRSDMGSSSERERDLETSDRRCNTGKCLCGCFAAV